MQSTTCGILVATLDCGKSLLEYISGFTVTVWGQDWNQGTKGHVLRVVGILEACACIAFLLYLFYAKFGGFSYVFKSLPSASADATARQAVSLR